MTAVATPLRPSPRPAVAARGLPGLAGQADEARPGSPWDAGDLLSLATAQGVAVALLLIGFLGTRGTTEPGELLLFLNMAAAGLVVALTGSTAFLLSGLRRSTALRIRLLPPDALHTAVLPQRDERMAQRQSPQRLDGLVAAAGMTRFHQADCQAAAGKSVTAAPLDRHESAGRRPCALCLPSHEAGPER